MRAYHETYGLPALITNCSNNYGPYQFPEKLIPLMVAQRPRRQAAADLRRRRQRPRLDLRRGPLPRRPRACCGAGGRERSTTSGGRSERTNLQIVDTICDLLESERPAAGNPALAGRGIASYRDLKTFVADRPGHDRRYAIDDAKIRARARLGAAARLQHGLRATVRWYLAHRAWCAAVQTGTLRPRAPRPEPKRESEVQAG